MSIWNLAVVAGGISGLAHALHTVRNGKRVVLFDRDACASLRLARINSGTGALVRGALAKR